MTKDPLATTRSTTYTSQTPKMHTSPDESRVPPERRTGLLDFQLVTDVDVSAPNAYIGSQSASVAHSLLRNYTVA